MRSHRIVLAKAGVLWWMQVWTALSIICATLAGNPDAKRLYDDLLSNYNKLVRPVMNTTDVLKVCIKLKLSQLIDVVSVPCPPICFHSSTGVHHLRVSSKNMDTLFLCE